MPRQLWIADQARKWGLTVVEVDGWQERGSASFSPAGVVCHHTAGPATGDMPSLRLLINGRSDVPGPLCNVGLARSGTVFVVAAGRANHAGKGSWNGLVGNSSVMGIEAENTGRGETWPELQLRAYQRLVAALASGMGRGPELICAHREWAPGRKPDPAGIEMGPLREEAARLLGAPPPAPPPPPPSSSESERIAELQRLVGVPDDGAWSDKLDDACKRNMVGWPKYVKEHAPKLADDLHGNAKDELVGWLQRQANRRFTANLAEDGKVGPATNHVVVVNLGQGDGVCGPQAFRDVVR